MENYEKAEQDYMGGMKYKDIAEKYGTTINTVKSWKKRYGWSRGEGAHKAEKVCTQKSKSAPKKPAPVDDGTKETLKNDTLTPEQQMFCIYYSRTFNATQSYMNAYGCQYSTALTNGPALLGNTRIKSEIQRLKQNRLNREMLDEHDIFQKYMDIAFADITDFVEFGQEDVYVMGAFGPIEIENPETGEKEYMQKKVNTVRFREHADIDGTLISEIKQGKDGASIKLADRMKALQWLTDHMYMATEEQKARIEKIRTETERIRKASGTDKSEQRVYIVNDLPEDDGYEDEESSMSE